MSSPVKIDYTKITNPVIEFELYNPSDQPVEFGYGGEVHVIPAAHQKWRGKDPRTGERVEYPEPGVLPVHNRPGNWIAKELLLHAVGDDGISGAVGKGGVRALFGDAEKDKLVKEDAKSTWEEKKYADCVALTRSHETAVRLANDNGTARPLLTERVQAAYTWLEKHVLAQGLRYTCEVCNGGFAEEKQLLSHQARIHKDKEAGAKIGIGVGWQPQEVPEPSMIPPGQRA